MSASLTSSADPPACATSRFSNPPSPSPRATFGGEFLHTDIASMAASYLFGIAKNHPFIDGNKRAAATAAIVFLELNGFDLEIRRDEELAEMTERIAASESTVDELVAFLRERIVEQ